MSRAVPGCLGRNELFHHPLVEEPLPSGAPRAMHRRQTALVAEAAGVCRECPLVAHCLYEAVVEYDVAGFAGGTTPVQRARIRRRLGISVVAEDFDSLAGVIAGNRQVDHAAVVRMRAANPQESLQSLARRLGCSLSTVKRHLRREREQPSLPTAAAPRPTLAEVLSAAAASSAALGRRRAA